MISEIKKDDTAILAEIHRQCFSDNWSEDVFTNMLNQEYFFGFIAEISSEKVGFILAKKIFDECEVITFCVLKNYRNRGVGKLLLNKLISLPIRIFFLEVAIDNYLAIHIYEEAKFKEISRRVGYYDYLHEKVDAIVMKLERQL